MVDDINVAQKLVKELYPGQLYAVDTEFERSRTFCINPALLQIRIGDAFYLVDIAIKDIAEVFLPGVKNLILHSGSEDLELWHQVTGEKPNEVFDTQVAAALCGFSLHTSYQNVVKEVFDVELVQGMSRSDWLQRPLSADQQAYAIEDVYYLKQLQEVFAAQLDERKLRSLFDVLMQQTLSSIDEDHHSEKLFQKWMLKQRLNAEAGTKLWRLLGWRDQQAKQRNMPRNWVLKPPQMLQIVHQVNQFEDLFNVDLYPKFVKMYGRELIKAIHDTEAYGEPPVVIKLDAVQGRSLSQMKQHIQQVTTERSIDPALIINAQSLKELVFTGGELTDLATWRALLESL